MWRTLCYSAVMAAWLGCQQSDGPPLMDTALRDEMRNRVVLDEEPADTMTLHDLYDQLAELGEGVATEKEIVVVGRVGGLEDPDSVTDSRRNGLWASRNSNSSTRPARRTSGRRQSTPNQNPMSRPRKTTITRRLARITRHMIIPTPITSARSATTRGRASKRSCGSWTTTVNCCRSTLECCSN